MRSAIVERRFDLIDSVRFTPDKVMSENPRDLFGLVVIKIGAEEFGYIVLKMFSIRVILKLLAQKGFQRLQSARLD